MRLIRLIIYLFFSIIFTSCDDEENILVQDAVKLLDQEDVLFLDVRTPQEFKYEGSIKNALLIPVNDLEKKIDRLVLSSNQTLIWDTFKQINYNKKVTGYGQLFDY